MRRRGGGGPYGLGAIGAGAAGACMASRQVVVVGGAGVGKTNLVRQLQRQLGGSTLPLDPCVLTVQLPVGRSPLCTWHLNP
eukprot:COSAG02_NODE_8839_length_2424_cov_5.339355_2_plen_81_part_00